MKLNKRISTLAIASLCATTASFAQEFDAESTGDVFHYGSSTGSIDQPGARVQVFGSTHQGETILVQVADAQPNAAVAIYLGFAPANIDIPGIGTALVDTSNAIRLTATTDANGTASVPVKIPPTVPAGTEIFAQCLVLGAGFELSSAAMIEIGEVERPLTMTSHLSGAVSVGADGAVGTASGMMAIDLTSSAVNVGYDAEIAVRASSANFTYGGASITELRVQPVPMDATTFWGPNEMYTTPDGGMSYPVSVNYESGGVSYGPFATAGVLMLGDGGVSLDLAPLPLGSAAGPLGGTSLAYDFAESFLGGSYFNAQAGVSLPTDGSSGANVTEGDVALSFATSQALLSTAISSLSGDTSFFDAAMPSFDEFYGLESEILMELTGGQASNVHDIHELILAGEISMEEGWGDIICSKLLAALGIKEGWKGFKEVFLEECGELLEEMGKDLDAGEYNKARKTLGKILGKVTGSKFMKKLGAKIGDKLAGEILAKVGSKFVPIVGWLYFAGSLLWAIIEQWF